MSKIALFGASGAIGRSIAAAFRARAQPYRVVGRNRAALEKAFAADHYAECVAWNPEDPLSIQAAAEGVETLIYMVGVEYWQFALHPVLMQKTLDAALAAGVKKILLIGTVYPYGLPHYTPLDEGHPRQPNSYKGKMRKAQEDLLMAANSSGKIEAAILRLPDFYGPDVEKSFLSEAIKAAQYGGTANMVGPLEPPHEFVFVPDVGPVVARLIEEEQAFGHVWHLAGVGVTSQREMIDEIERQIGRKLKIRVAGKTVLRLFGLFNPFMRELVEMHYLLTDPVIMDDSALQRLIGPIAKTSYRGGISQCLEFGREASRLTVAGNTI